jgi:hypothetical protein
MLTESLTETSIGHLKGGIQQNLDKQLLEYHIQLVESDGVLKAIRVDGIGM